MKTIKDVRDYSRKHDKMDTINECWTDEETQQFLDECKAENKNPKEVIDTLISIWNEEREAARYFSGECYEDEERYSYEDRNYNRLYHSEEQEETYDDYANDPCYGCMACDHSYNCKHCPHGDDGRYESPFDVYTPSELGLSVHW